MGFDTPGSIRRPLGGGVPSITPPHPLWGPHRDRSDPESRPEAPPRSAPLQAAAPDADPGVLENPGDGLRLADRHGDGERVELLEHGGGAPLAQRLHDL